MVQPGRVKRADGGEWAARAAGQRDGAARGRSAGPGGSGPRGPGGTRAERRRAGQQHPLGLHCRGAQRADQRAHPAATVSAGPGQGAEPRGHDPGGP